jgi:hypothetical protein
MKTGIMAALTAILRCLRLMPAVVLVATAVIRTDGAE